MIASARFITAAVCGFVMLLIGIEQFAPGQAQVPRATPESAGTKQTNDDPDEPMPTRAERASACLALEEKWHVLNTPFRRVPKETSAEVTKGMGIITQMTFSVKHGITEEKIDIRIDDKDVLQRLENAMRMPLRYGFSNDGTGGGGFLCGGAFAVLKVSATDGDFEIGICPVGFLIDAEEGPDFNNIFFSWALANNLDQIWFQKTGKHFPESIFKRLSGISWLESQGWKP